MDLKDVGLVSMDYVRVAKVGDTRPADVHTAMNLTVSVKCRNFWLTVDRLPCEEGLAAWGFHWLVS
jgi:hypothetical protein